MTPIKIGVDIVVVLQENYHITVKSLVSVEERGGVFMSREIKEIICDRDGYYPECDLIIRSRSDSEADKPMFQSRRMTDAIREIYMQCAIRSIIGIDKTS